MNIDDAVQKIAGVDLLDIDGYKKIFSEDNRALPYIIKELKLRIDTAKSLLMSDDTCLVEAENMAALRKMRPEMKERLEMHSGALRQAFEESYVTECSVGDIVAYSGWDMEVGVVVSTDGKVDDLMTVPSNERQYPYIWCQMEEQGDAVHGDPVAVYNDSRLISIGIAKIEDNGDLSVCKERYFNKGNHIPNLHTAGQLRHLRAVRLVAKRRVIDVRRGPYR